MAKATHATSRSRLQHLTEIINIGPSIAEDLRGIGLASPQDLIGADPLQVYQKLIRKTEKFHDPCVLDVFMAAVDYMDGNQPQVWWKFTSRRKEIYHEQVDELRAAYSR